MAVETSRFKDVEKIIRNVLASGRETMLPDEALGIIESSGISTPDYVIAKTAKEAIEASRTIGFPVVLKVVSPDALHKSNVGGVVVGVESEEEVEKHYNGIMDNLAKDIPDACITGILVQKQARQATEVII